MTKELTLRFVPRLHAYGVQFDTSLREKCFLRRTCRRRKRFNLFFRFGEKTLRGFFDSLRSRDKSRLLFVPSVQNDPGHIDAVFFHNYKPYAEFLKNYMGPSAKQAPDVFCVQGHSVQVYKVIYPSKRFIRPLPPARLPVPRSCCPGYSSPPPA